MSDHTSVVVEPKIEQVEYWSFVGAYGPQTVYMVRVERGEKGQVLHNQIDGSPIEVQLLLRSDDDKNAVVGTVSFPIRNLFSYSMEKGEYAVYPKGHSPAEKAVSEEQTRLQNSLVMRKRRFEAIIGGITDLRDGPEPAQP